MTYRFQCHCGSVQGLLAQPSLALRGVCYCKDCRAYSNHLGATARTHDELGGAEFLAAQVKQVQLTKGVEHLACMSLSASGLLRWYSSCCTTPIANTLRNWKVPYVSLVHTCLKADPAAFEATFPRLHMRVNTKSARQAPPAHALKTIGSLAGFIPKVVAGSLTGAYKRNPFLTAPAGEPLVPVTVLSKQERELAYRGA